MDLKDINNKDILISNIDELFADFSVFLKDNIEKGGRDYKKAAMLYYWLRDYKNYIKNETNFLPKYMPSFQRGHVINVNFGFNIGSEFGGLHYAVVLSDSGPKNPNLIIVPLKSYKPGITKLHKTEVFLGNELYNRLYGKHAALKVSIEKEKAAVNQVIHKSHEKIQLLQSLSTEGNKTELEELLNQIIEEHSIACKKINDIEKHSSILESIWKKLSKMNGGSIALVGHIKTISKMRVINPLSPDDVLYGIKLPAHNLDLISQKINEVYIDNH